MVNIFCRILNVETGQWKLYQLTRNSSGSKDLNSGQSDPSRLMDLYKKSKAM
jgi:hypothetical protein